MVVSSGMRCTVCLIGRLALLHTLVFADKLDLIVGILGFGGRLVLEFVLVAGTLALADRLAVVHCKLPVVVDRRPVDVAVHLGKLRDVRVLPCFLWNPLSLSYYY
jgi:hypothetical protein